MYISLRVYKKKQYAKSNELIFAVFISIVAAIWKILIHNTPIVY